MLVIRVIGTDVDAEDDLVFNIDYKDLYSEFIEWNYKRDEMCIIDILSLLCKDKKILFEFTEYDKNLDSDKEELSNEFLDSYHKDFISKPNEGWDNEVKNILIKHYKGNKICSEDEEVFKEKLMYEFKNTSLRDMDKNLLKDIGEFLYNKTFISCLSDYSEEKREFINKRVSIISKEYEFPYNTRLNAAYMPQAFIRNLWVDLSIKDDMTYWFKNISSYFSCVITSENGIEDYDYFLQYDWHWINTTELRLLNVLERNKGDFVNKVFPLLERAFGFEINIATDID